MSIHQHLVIARWSYRITQLLLPTRVTVCDTDSRTCGAVIKAAKLIILFKAAETSWKLKAHPTACAKSHLALENVMTVVTCSGQVYSYRPRPPTSYTVCWQLAAVQWTRRLAEVGWQVMVQAFRWPGGVGGSASLCVLPGWAKQTTEFMRSQLLGTRCYIPARSAIHIYACLAYISQSISQAIQPSIAPYMASESDAIYCAQRPPTTNVSLHAIAACCQFDHWLWKFKDWLRNNSSFTSLVCTEYIRQWRHLRIGVPIHQLWVAHICTWKHIQKIVRIGCAPTYNEYFGEKIFSIGLSVGGDRFGMGSSYQYPIYCFKLLQQSPDGTSVDRQ